MDEWMAVVGKETSLQVICYGPIHMDETISLHIIDLNHDVRSDYFPMSAQHVFARARETDNDRKNTQILKKQARFSLPVPIPCYSNAFEGLGHISYSPTNNQGW